MACWINVAGIKRCVMCDDVVDKTIGCDGIPCAGKMGYREVIASCLRSCGPAETSNNLATIEFRGKASYGSYGYRAKLYEEKKSFRLGIVRYTEFLELGRKFILPDQSPISYEMIENAWDMKEAYVMTYDSWVIQIRTVLKYKARITRNGLFDATSKLTLMNRAMVDCKRPLAIDREPNNNEALEG